MNIKLTLGAISIAATLALTGCGNDSSSSDPKSSSTDPKQEVLKTYADIAIVNYKDALADAEKMATAVKAFTTAPSEATLTAAKESWLTARESYGTTEIFRLSNGPIDGEEDFSGSWDAPEGQLNAWPLDENMIDYTNDENGSKTTGNIIDAKGDFQPNGDGASAVDTATITTAVISALNENGGDANVATGYHAVEFLLWGQDQDYVTSQDYPGADEANSIDGHTGGSDKAGQRPFTDYTTADNADRRKAYLNASADLIVEDLKKMVDAWGTDADDYRAAFLGEGKNKIAQATALKQIMGGMGVFIKSELANERIAVAVLTPSEEDEHSCFSDNTHRDIVLNYQGFINVLKGEYKGKSMGKSMYSMLDDDTKTKVDALIASIDAGVKKIDEKAATVHFDYQIRDKNSGDGLNIKRTKNDMRDLGDKMILVAKALGITLSATDVTDADETEGLEEE